MSGNTHQPASEFDLVVIGGGINGAGIARDAAGRGLSVLLVEKDDLAEHTSSASTKLIHGGLRYLEHYDFMLVRHALQEREVLLRAAPHIIWPLRFVLPHHKALRPKWLIRLGLFLYDHIGGRKMLPASHSLDLTSHVSGAALKKEFKSGFEYSDCWVQDARLVSLNVLDAAERGCDVRTRCECTDLVRQEGQWQVHLHNKFGDTRSIVSAKAVVNASGPWVEETLDLDEEHDSKHGVRFQNADNRVLFAVPYEQNYTLLGTTDVEVDDKPAKQHIDTDEIDYICKSVGEYFEKPVDASTVVWSYAGVRPLYDDASENASKVTRDYKLDLDERKNAPILSVYGGKITTYRKLAEQAVELLQAKLNNHAKTWTADVPLPGGDIANADFDAYMQELKSRYSWLDESLLLDYARNYGTRISTLLNDAASMGDLGQHFSGPLYQCEVDYLVKYEWARSAEDILWRRSKKGLHTDKNTADELQAYLDATYAFEAAHALPKVS